MISVISCTYNRASLLQDLLQTLCEQSLPPPQHKVIVIDNGSTPTPTTSGKRYGAVITQPHHAWQRSVYDYGTASTCPAHREELCRRGVTDE